jgi:predicted nucleotidyltransferase
MNLISPTSYPDVNEILDLLLSSVKEILREQFVGMYLFGSLAYGDFDQDSDIDVLIVTDGDISKDRFIALKEMHKRIQEIDSRWAFQMEVAYLPGSAIRRYDPDDDQHPYLDRGTGEELHLRPYHSDWVVQRHILRQRGITIVGPEPETLIDPVSPDDLRRAMYPILFEWYAHFLEKPDPWDSRGYQSYAVLSLCRIMYTLEKGDVVSKMTAARWAKEYLDPRWIPLIESALLGRQKSVGKPLPKDVDETLDMIRYAMRRAKPTPYPDVNEVLNVLLSNVKEILGDQFVGMYLYGSLSSGDFNPKSSDIDFLVVTRDSLSEESISKLDVMHKQVSAASLGRAGQLEGSYVPRELIRHDDPYGMPCPTINEGEFNIAPLGDGWNIQRYVVREYGVIVEGPDPKTLIDFVSADDIRSAVISVLNDWWFPMLDDPSWLRDHDRGHCAFAVITMCRVFHALQHGTIVSKPKAVQWIRPRLDDEWKHLIDKAVAISDHEDVELTLSETLDFIRYTKSTLQSSGLPVAE